MFKNMFTNIGGKIKLTAKIACWISMVASFVGGIILLIYSIVEAEDELIIVGLIVPLVAPFLCWIGSFVMYGFGELIEKTTEIAENTRNNSQ